MPKVQLKISFQLPGHAADWAGQALQAYFPDGLLSGTASLPWAEFSGWPRSVRPQHLQQLRSHLSSIGARRIRVQAQRTRDWVTEYKSRFPVQRIGPFVILPKWRRHSKQGTKLPIVLLPGQAFGTGLHASTRLMLHALAASAQVDRVLDIGAGSGILGLACLRRGAKRVLAIEVERAACEEMKGNRELNGFKPSAMTIRKGTFPAVMGGRPAQANLVLANLVTPLLCELMESIAAQAIKGGTLLFSGIHTEGEARKVAKAARDAGLGIQQRSSKGAWWCLRASK